MKTVFPSGWSGAHRSILLTVSASHVDLHRISVDHADHRPTAQTRVGCVMLDTKASSPRSGVDVVKENKCIGQHAVQILYKIYYVYMKHMDEHLRAGQNKIRTCEKYSSAR